MSKFGHFSKQYYGNKIEFPKESFLISGISYYKDNCENITYNSKLSMIPDIHNVYDKTAISILYEGFIIGYVPNNDYVKELCKNNISDNLIIINIKQIKHNIGIRVIPETFYKKDKNLEREVFFSDDF
jgi:hypothetical protein